MGEQFEGRHVIGLSGHKNESTIKQYATRLPERKKHEMSKFLADTITPNKVPKKYERNFYFKAASKATSQPTSTILVPPQNNSNPHAAVENENKPPAQVKNNLELQLEPVQNAPEDDVLINFLAQFDAATENPLQEILDMVPPVQQNAKQIQQEFLGQIKPFQPSNTMNINSVQNVQNNVNPNQQNLPNMYFGGHSSVVINYNFTPK